jgi:hypothetical protein
LLRVRIIRLDGVKPVGLMGLNKLRTAALILNLYNYQSHKI